MEDRAQDGGTAGKDNTYGAGRLRLAPAGNALLAPPQPFSGMTPQRLFDSRPGIQFPAESPNRTTPLGPNGKVQVQVRGLVGVPVDATAVVLNEMRRLTEAARPNALENLALSIPTLRLEPQADCQRYDSLRGLQHEQ